VADPAYVAALRLLARRELSEAQIRARLARGGHDGPSIDAAIGVLYMTGYTLNTLTMMGLMLSSGMLVDNAAVDAASLDVVDELLIEEISIDGMCGVY
jgi:mycofactocin precursor